MQAHTLGEVGTLPTILLGVSSGIILPIFIEIGSYLTDKEQKISWHSFFEKRCIIYKSMQRHNSRKNNSQISNNSHVSMFKGIQGYLRSY